jgi:hypothetical protein
LPSTFTLPASAVVTQGGEVCCFRVDNGKAVRMPIKIGARDGQSVQLLKKRNGAAAATDPGAWEDFTGTEEIVLAGSASLADGQPVSKAEKQ